MQNIYLNLYYNFGLSFDVNFWNALGGISTFLAVIVALAGPYIFNYYKERKEFKALLDALKDELYFNYDQLFANENREFSLNIFDIIREKYSDKIDNKEIYFHLQRVYADLKLFIQEREEAKVQINEIRNAAFIKPLSGLTDKEIMVEKKTFEGLIDIQQRYREKFKINAINKFFEFFDENEMTIIYEEDSTLEELQAMIGLKIDLKGNNKDKRIEKIDEKIRIIFSS